MENTKTPIIPTQIPTNQQGNISVSEAVIHKLSTYSHDQLLKALYWVWDAFERANVPFFLVYETAEQAMKKRDLEGDKITVGVRKVEWVSGGKRILDAFLGEPVTQTETTAHYLYEGVPVVISIFEDDDCIKNLNPVVYGNEYFNLPNPYSRFLHLYARPD